ncbi:MAG: YraN family protein [Desulfobacterales bacterium]
MTLSQHQFGRQSEVLAVAYLKQCGWRILATNHRTPFGEIDIIARDRDSVVFVEVKARRNRRFGSPKHALTPTKQRKLSLSALHYLKATRNLNQRARFDVLAMGNQRSGPQIELIKNAFEMVSLGG